MVMTRQILIVSLFISISMIACTHKQDKSLSNKEYIAHIQQAKDGEFNEEAQQQARKIKETLNSLDEFELYFSFSFGLSDGSSGSQPEAAEAFTLPSADATRADFYDPGRRLYFTEHKRLPEPAFEFNTGYKDEGFQSLSIKDFKYNIQKIYLKNQAVAAKDIRLRSVDSLEVTVRYSYPTAFDTVTITRSQPEVLYKNTGLKVHQFDDQKLVIDLPIDISSNILAYHGITADGTIIASNGHSSFPLTIIKPALVKELMTLQEAFQAADKARIQQVMEESKNNLLPGLSLLESLEKEVMAYEESEENLETEVETLKQLIKDYAAVLETGKQRYEITFPYEVKAVHLYIASAFDSLQRTLTVQNALPERPEFEVFKDDANDLYGIVDKSGSITIPAKYKDLHSVADHFFIERQKGDFYTHYLDVEQKTLKQVPGKVTFYQDLGNGLYSFHDENRKLGVLDKNFEVVLPFQYQNATYCAGLLVMSYNHRGRIYQKIFTRPGKEIEIPGIIKNSSCADSYLILENREGKSAILNKQGKLILPFNYYIDGHNDAVAKHLASYTSSKNESALKGLVNTETGKIVVPEEKGFYHIYPFSEGLAAAIFSKNQGDKMGFINEMGETVIPPQFLYANNFYKELACVLAADEQVYLITPTGKVVKSFPGIVQNEEHFKKRNYGYKKETEDGLVYYEINERYYNDQGEPLNKELTREN